MSDVERRRAANRGIADRKKRKQLRTRLEAEGVHPALIDKIIEQRRWEDLVARVGLDLARAHAQAFAHKGDPDDTGYEPKDCDPLLRGAARATGKTAKIVTRRTTVTEYQYDRMP